MELSKGAGSIKPDICCIKTIKYTVLYSDVKGTYLKKAS